MNIRLGFATNNRVLIVLFPTNKMLVVTKIANEKHCDKVLLRSHMSTVLSLLKYIIWVLIIARAKFILSDAHQEVCCYKDSNICRYLNS